jgi:hypothetical protein
MNKWFKKLQLISKSENKIVEIFLVFQCILFLDTWNVKILQQKKLKENFFVKENIFYFRI